MANANQRPQGGRAGYYIYLLPGVVGFLVIVAVPLVANFWISLLNWRGIGKARRRPGTADRIGNADAAAIATLVQSIEHVLPQILFAAPEMCAAGDVDQ